MTLLLLAFVILYNECILLLSSEENQLTEGNESLITVHVKFTASHQMSPLLSKG